MCMGYSKEIKVWVCEQTRMQTGGMLEAGGRHGCMKRKRDRESLSTCPTFPMHPKCPISDLAKGLMTYEAFRTFDDPVALFRPKVNEAFAAIALVCLHELGLAEDVVHVEGGAINDLTRQQRGTH